MLSSQRLCPSSCRSFVAFTAHRGFEIPVATPLPEREPSRIGLWSLCRIPRTRPTDQCFESNITGRRVLRTTRAERHRLLPLLCSRKKEGSRGPDGAARDSKKFRKSRKFSLGALGDNGGRESSLAAPKS